jgi:hypothetical protein
MRNIRDFDNILDECLDRVMQGQDIEKILALYPEHAAELEPLLKTAKDTMTAAAIKPRPEFRQRAANEFQTAIRNTPPQKARNSFRWQLQWMAPVALVIVLVLGGGGTVVAASNSLPDSPLYKVKLATEAVQLAFASSDTAKAELYARFSDKRVEEIVKLAEKGNTEQVARVTERMNNQLIAMSNLTASGEESLATMSLNAMQAPAATSMPTTKATMIPAPTTPPKTAVPSTTQPSVSGASPGTTGVTPPVIVPEPTVTDALRSHAQSDSAGSEFGNNNRNITQKNDRNEKLKNNLVKKTEKNLKALQDQLEKAPEPLKSEIQKAIDILLNGYQTNISNLHD